MSALKSIPRADLTLPKVAANTRPLRAQDSAAMAPQELL